MATVVGGQESFKIAVQHCFHCNVRLFPVETVAEHELLASKENALRRHVGVPNRKSILQVSVDAFLVVMSNVSKQGAKGV